MKVKSESEVAQSCPTLATPWTAAYQAPPSMGFSRQEYWSGVPLPSPYTMEYHSALKRNKFESVELRWMNLELVTQREVGQEKNIIYKCIYMESRKMILMNLFAGQK